jgi:hypothetical protein
MSRFGDRRIAVPVPVQQKPSLWKSLRRTVRHPLRRFAPADEERDARDYKSPHVDAKCISASPVRERHLGNHNLSTIATMDSRFEHQAPAAARPRGRGAAADHKKKKRSPSKKKKKKDTKKSPREASPKRFTAEKPRKAPASPAYAYAAPYQNATTRYDAPYKYYGEMPAQQEREEEWDRKRYSYGARPTAVAAPRYSEYEDSRRPHRDPSMNYCENPYYQQDSDEYYYNQPPKYGLKRDKLHGRMPHKNGRRRNPEKSCIGQVGCAAAPQIFGADSFSQEEQEDYTQGSGSWTVDPVPMQRGTPAGVFESTILQTYTDTTFDASLLDAEAHNAILTLSNKVKTDICQSAETVGHVFIRATDKLLNGKKDLRDRRGRTYTEEHDGISDHYGDKLLNGKKDLRDRRGRTYTEEHDGISDHYGKYLDKLAGYQPPDAEQLTEQFTDIVTEPEEETMTSSVLSTKKSDSSLEEIEMNGPRWRALSFSALSFGRKSSDKEMTPRHT